MGEGWEAEKGQSRFGSGYLKYPKSLNLNMDLGMANNITEQLE